MSNNASNCAFFRSRSSSSLQFAGVKSAVEVLSARRLASSQDATTDRSPLLRTVSSPSIAVASPTTKERRRTESKGKGLRNLFKRDSQSSTNVMNVGTGSDFFINELKKSLKDIQFDLLIMQIQNSQPHWLSNFIESNGPSLLLGHLTKENYIDEVKEKFLPCLRCFHTLIKRSDERLLEEICKFKNLENLIRILMWTSDLFLMSSTCMTLIDVCNSPAGHKYIVQALSSIANEDNHEFLTYPFICALHLINPAESSKSIRICGEVVVTLFNTFLMNLTNIEERFNCETEILTQGTLPFILELRRLSNLQNQLDIFEQILTSDLNDLAGKKSARQGQSSKDFFTVRMLSAVEGSRQITIDFEPDMTIQNVLEIIAVKQEYLGYSVGDISNYGLFIAGHPLDKQYVNLYGKVMLEPSRNVSFYKMQGEVQVDFRMKPWQLEVSHAIYGNDEIVDVWVNPDSTVESLLRLLLNAPHSTDDIDATTTTDGDDAAFGSDALQQEEGAILEHAPEGPAPDPPSHPPSRPPPPPRDYEGISKVEDVEEQQQDEEYQEEGEYQAEEGYEEGEYTEVEYGLFWPTNEIWLPSLSQFRSFKGLTSTPQLLLAVKVSPIVIKFKEQSFNVEIASTSISIGELVIKALAKLGITEPEQASRYALFLDALASYTADLPDTGLLEPEQTVQTILDDNFLNVLVLSLAIKPNWLQISPPPEITGGEVADMLNVRLLFNQRVREGLDIICSLLRYDAESYQLVTSPDMVKLNEALSFESQQIAPNTHLYLIKREVVPEGANEENNGDINIWEEEKSDATFILEAGTNVVAAATLNQLVRMATDELEYDSSFLNTFMATYRSFTTPEILWRKLLQRYEVPAEMAPDKKNLIQSKVCVVMKRWIESFLDDEERKMIDKVSAWVIKKMQGVAAPKMLSGVKQAIAKQSQLNHNNPQFYFKTQPPTPRLPKEKYIELLKFDELDMLEVARQLSLVAFDAFSKIKPVELFGQAWSRAKTQHLCPNLMKVINHFNYISKAVSSMIVSEPKLRQRVKIYEKMIQLAENLRNLNNFNLLTAVISGLNSSSVGRLTWTKARANSRSLLVLEQLEELTSMNQSYKNYRSAEQVEPPLIPYLGVYLQDLTFIEDGNPDYINENLVNFSKRVLVRKTMAKLSTFQQEAYNFVTVPLLRAFLENLPQLSEDEQYKNSLLIEPRNAKRNEIE